MNIETVTNRLYRTIAASTLLAMLVIAQVAQPVFAASRATPFAPGDTLDPGLDASPCGPTDANCFPSVTQIRPVGTSTGMTGLMQWFALNGVNNVGFRAPDSTLAGNVLWTLPNATGTAGQVMINDGAGNLNWGMLASVTAIASGTATNNTIRWNGGQWVANTNFNIDTNGNATGTSAALTYNSVAQSTTTNAWVTNLAATNAVLGSSTLAELYVVGKYKDSTGSAGTVGQVLTSTGTTTKWTNVAAGGSLASGTANNTTLYWNGSNWVENTTFLAGLGSSTMNGNFTINNTLTTNGNSVLATTTMTAATSSSFFASLFSAVTAFITNLTTTNATATNLVATNATTTNLAILNGLRVTSGGTGTTTAPSNGQILVGNANGGYDYVSTSSLFVASSTFASSTTIGATVIGAQATGIFFIDPTTGKLAQDTANFNYDPTTQKLKVSGGIDPVFFSAQAATATNAYYEAFGGQNAATSTAGSVAS